jgi:hypothetical protein
MADISVVSRLVAGIPRDVNLTNNSLVVGSLKVGSVSPTELTKAILDRLVALQNGSDVDATYHTHDGRYFTETELGATSGTSGAQRIGVKGTPVNHTPATADVQGFLDSIDAALASAGGTAFSDAEFEIQNDSDATKVLKFDASAIATGTTRTVSMPNADVDLADVNQAILQDGTRPMLADLDINGNKLLNLAAGTAAGHAVEFTQFQNALSGLDFQRDVNAVVLDGATEFPGTGLPAAASGQRYIVVDTSAMDAAWGTIAGLGDNDIIEYDGADWNVAYDVSVQGAGALVWDKDAATFVRWDGTTWAEFGGLAGVTAGNGLEKSGNVLFLNFNELAGVAVASGDEFAFGDVSDSNIVKKITFSSLNSSLDHNELTNYEALEHVNHSTVQIATAAGSGLSGGGTIEATRNLVVDITGTTQETQVAPNDEILIWDSSASARRKATISDLHKNTTVTDEFVAGEAFLADTTYAVRIAISGETVGRVYKADFDASASDAFYVIGVVQLTADAAPGDTIPVIIKGTVTLAANDTAFSAGEIGQPVHLKAAGAWDAVSTITYTANQASFRFGMVRSTTTIYMDGSKQLNGIAG